MRERTAQAGDLSALVRDPRVLAPACGGDLVREVQCGAQHVLVRVVALVTLAGMGELPALLPGGADGVELVGGERAVPDLRFEDRAQELALLGGGHAQCSDHRDERDDPDQDGEQDAERRAIAERHGAVPAPVRDHRQHHQADPQPQPPWLDRGADREDETAAEQRGEERVGEDAAERACREGAQRGVGLVDAERRDGGVERVQDVLEELESEPDEGADEDAVVGGADQPRREPEQQDEPGRLGGLLVNGAVSAALQSAPNAWPNSFG